MVDGPQGQLSPELLDFIRRCKEDYEGTMAEMKAEADRRRNSDDPKERESQAAADKFDAFIENMKREMQERHDEGIRRMEAKEFSDDPDERLDWFFWNRMRTCKHDGLPFVKSHYSDEMVKRGRCPDCGLNLLELD
jgi:hypothetical protein